MNQKLIIGIIVSMVVVGLTWVFIKSMKPLPGQTILWDSRNHIAAEGTKIDYVKNSKPNLVDNEPPTSGDHYPSWITKGFYDEPRADGYLVHSLEHGYIIISYNCEAKSSGLIPTVYAQNQQLMMTSGSVGSSSASLSQMPKAFSDGSCNSMKDQIKQVISKIGSQKMIAVPRVGMDSEVILTSWGKMEKLFSVNQDLISAFVNVYRDNGPEQTSEP